MTADILDQPDYHASSDVYDSIRPPYQKRQTKAVIEHLGITKDSVVAEMAAGTGLLSEHFRQDVCKELLCVEPKPLGMHDKLVAKIHAKGWEGHTQAIDAFAKDTTIADHSVDAIVMGDAGHWMNPAEVLPEWRRILKPGGKIAVFDRFPNTRAPVVQMLHTLLMKNCPDYAEPGANKLLDENPVREAEKKGEFLVNREYEQPTAQNIAESWDEAQLLKYLQSRSSTGKWAKNEANDPDVARHIQGVIDEVFDRCAGDNHKISFPYIHYVACGELLDVETALSRRRHAEADAKRLGQGDGRHLG